MASETGDFRRWDVAVALFPFTGSTQRKPRPILVLTDAGFNGSHGHVIAAMITTGANTGGDVRCASISACASVFPVRTYRTY